MPPALEQPSQAGGGVFALNKARLLCVECEAIQFGEGDSRFQVRWV